MSVCFLFCVCVCVYAHLVPCLFLGENLSVALLKSHRKQLCLQTALSSSILLDKSELLIFLPKCCNKAVHHLISLEP